MPTATKKATFQQGRWYRFSEYQIKDGRIVPGAAAKAWPYDLLKRDRPLDDRRERNASRIYARLIETVTASIDPHPEEDDDDGWRPIRATQILSAAVRERILEFSTEFGLLGILHRGFSRIVGPIASMPDGARRRWYCQRGEYIENRSSQWGRYLIHSKAEETLPLVDRYGFCVGAAYGATDATFDEVNCRYFDGHLPNALPLPDSEDFFRIYGEPVEEWIEAAAALATAIRKQDDGELNNMMRVAWTEHVLGPSLARVDFRVGSLLEAAVFQFFEDFSGGFELRCCENESCTRRLYYDNDPRSRFCSQRCAAAQRQREHRRATRSTRKPKAVTKDLRKQ